ncbi:succinate dehydrogenase cytochrome b subunit [Cytophagaceae bacterium ABcell3]|nr:succinate dehydrogenase cytochrome b subunit [Cytophagaceae bacterium ABcell3]
MNWFARAFSGSIGRKLIMSLTGIFLISFLIVHLSGNFLLIRDDGGVAFNAYAHFMKENPIIKLMEIVLAFGFIFHIVFAAFLTSSNKKARPTAYAHNNASANSSWFSRNMGLTGSIILIFLILHLRTFFIPHKAGWFEPRADNMYDEAVIAFSSGLYVLFYVFAMILLAFHLVHGFSSAFQTLGLRHPKYFPAIRLIGYGFAIIVPLLFAFIPVYMYFAQQ